ncbi:phage tail protein [Helcococcus sueciensis]|uniref:phage tail protein n=1 Tax=Helcococcus sueciensis TaxID=241555 RepID=UPI0004140081|nr:hypothetical protein [Helcococcus sueciensis]
METLEELRVLIHAELDPYKKEMKQIVNETRNTSNAIQKETGNIKKAFQSMGSYIKRAVIGLGLVKFGKQALNLASDVEETEAVLELAFGNMRNYVDDFAKNSIRTHGMSALSAKQTAGDYMLMSKGMGMVDENAAKMSVNVAKLSADMASLKNTSQDMAKTALNGIWTGETEALKKYGVVMTQANLQEYAYTQGIKTKIANMTQQEQVMLRYSYVMNSMSIANGNFIRESQGWAAQTKILGEQWKELLTIIGQGLTVVLLPVLRFINKIMSGLIALGKVVGQVFSSIFGMKGSSEKTSKVIDPVNTSVNTLNDTLGDIDKKGTKGLNNLGKSAEQAGKKAKGALAGFDDLNVLTNPEKNTNLKNPTIGAGGIGTDGVGGIGTLGNIPDLSEGIKAPNIDTSWVDKYVEKIRNGLEKAKRFFDEHKAGIISAIAGIVTFITIIVLSKFPTLTWALTHPIKSAKGIWFMGIESIKGAITALSTTTIFIAGAIALVVGAVVYLWQTSESFRNSVLDTWEKIKDLFTTVFEGVKKELMEFWEEYGQPIMQGLSDAWENFVNIVDSLWQGILKPIVDAGIEMLEILWTNKLQPLFKKTLTKLGETMKVVLKLWNEILAPLIQWLIDILSPVVKFVTDAFVKAWEFVLTAIKPYFDGISILIKGISNFLQGLIDFVKNVFIGDWDKAWESLEKAFTELWDGIKGYIKGVWDSILNIFVGVGTWFYNNVLSPITSVFTNAFNSIGNFISDKWNWILGLFTKGGKFFSGIAESIGGVFVNIVNGLISGINWVIAQPFSFLNGILNSISEFSILGGRPFGWIGYNPLPVPQIPYLDVGTNYVARDGLAMIHEGEAVVPKKYNPAINGNNEQIELLKEQNSLLRLLLEKDNSVYLDGDKLHQSNEKRKRQEFERYGYAY